MGRWFGMRQPTRLCTWRGARTHGDACSGGGAAGRIAKTSTCKLVAGPLHVAVGLLAAARLLSANLHGRLMWPASPRGAPLGAEDTGRAGRKRRAGGLCLLDVKQAVVGCLHMGWLALVAGWLALAVGCPVSQHLGEASRWARAGPRTPHGGPIAAGMSPSALKLLCGACCAAPAWCYHHCSVLSPVWTPAAAETLANVHCTRHCFSRTRRLSTCPPTSQTAAAAEALAQTLGSRRAQNLFSPTKRAVFCTDHPQMAAAAAEALAQSLGPRLCSSLLLRSPGCPPGHIGCRWRRRRRRWRRPWARGRRRR